MDFVTALAEPNQPDATLSALESYAQQVIGARLFTLMTLDRDAAVARRSYSNMPDAYPVSGEKPIEQNAWTDHVLGARKTFVANTIDEIAAVFGDHALIQSLGCESCINIPIVLAGRVAGTINCLHDAGHFTTERIALSEQLKAPGAMAFMMERLEGKSL